MTSLDSLLADHELYHSDFQMDSLITVRAGGTEYGCYKQALRELWKRCRGLRELYAKESLLRIDLDELEEKPPDSNPFELRRREVAQWEKSLLLGELAKAIQETEREFLRFYGQALSLKSTIGDLDSERRAKLDQEMWEHRLKCSAAVDLMSTGRFSATTIDAIAACPHPIRQRLVNAVFDRQNHGQLVDWFLSQRIEVPCTSLHADLSVRKLLQCFE